MQRTPHVDSDLAGLERDFILKRSFHSELQKSA
jgi:hypothetical protein